MEIRDRPRAGEVYTIRQVAEMTGVPENTIRSWERRFGIPRPTRSGGNQRRYTEREAGVIRSIQAARDQGRTMEQAIQEAAHHGAKPAEHQETITDALAAPVTPPRPARCQDPAITRLVTGLAAFDDAGADAIVSESVWGTSVEAVCADVLLPSLRTIDEQRAAGSLSAIQACHAQAWIRMKLVSALDQSKPGTGRFGIMAAAMHDASAEDDALCLALLLSRAGYRVTWLGGGATVEDLLQTVDVLLPVAVLLAARSDLSIVASRAAVERLDGTRQTGAWQGAIGVTCAVPPVVGNVVEIPIDASRAVEILERALQARASTLRIVRNE